MLKADLIDICYQLNSQFNSIFHQIESCAAHSLEVARTMIAAAAGEVGRFDCGGNARLGSIMQHRQEKAERAAERAATSKEEQGLPSSLSRSTFDARRRCS